jgi:hypothetical protein
MNEIFMARIAAAEIILNIFKGLREILHPTDSIRTSRVGAGPRMRERSGRAAYSMSARSDLVCKITLITI